MSVHFQEMLHDTTRITLEVLYPRNSELNKVVLFDKVSVGEQLPPPTVRGWAVSKRERLLPRHCSKICCICPWQGCTFLCVFGLTGEKLHHKNTHALQSAIQIFQSCSTMLKDVE